jgi:hypothetical protein
MRSIQEGRASYCFRATPVMQMSYLAKRVLSKGAEGTTGMMMDSSTDRQTRSKSSQ